MHGIGVIVNIVAVLAGTAVGLAFGRLISERFRTIAFAAIGLAVIIIGAAISLGGLADLGKTRLGDYAALVLVGSLVMEEARRAAVPAGDALAVDREAFARAVTERIGREPLVELVREEATSLPDPGDGFVVVATGPLSKARTFA